MSALQQRHPFGLDATRLLLVVAGVVVALVLVHAVDHPLSAWLQDAPAGLIAFMDWYTRWGLSDWILYPALVVVFICWVASLPGPFARAYRELAGIAAFIFIGVGVPSLVSTLLKRAIGRARPTLYDTVGSLHFQPNLSIFDAQSFPSGHTTTAFALACVIGVLWPRWFGLGLVYAVGIGLSRMILGEHYPTDVIGGVLLGSIGALLIRNFFADRGWAFEWHGDSAVKKTEAIRVAFRRH